MVEQRPEFYFDRSMPLFLDILEKELGMDVVKSGLVIRDTTGRLSFIPASKLPDNKRQSVAEKVIAALGPYAYPDRVIAVGDEPGSKNLLLEAVALPVVARDGSVRCNVIDRRLVGADWLTEPMDKEAIPPRIVFGSLKGGVGRSTALAVLAADLARLGHNVLVVDLDLEAPGVGHTLLDDQRLPLYGAIDYLVENGIGGVTDRALSDFIGVSELTRGGGIVDILPACGQTSRLYPENFMAKLSRAMIEDLPSDNKPITVRQQIREMVDRFSSRKNYDAILIDARAGMAEIAAAPLLGLGATLLLFGTAQRQTIDGYRSLFATFSTLANRNPNSPWRKRIKMVYAKAVLDDTAMSFSDEMWDLFSTYLYDSTENLGDLETFNFQPDDENAPHVPLVIPFHQGFVNWDPLRNPSQLTASFYENAFRPFLDAIEAMIFPVEA